MNELPPAPGHRIPDCADEYNGETLVAMHIEALRAAEGCGRDH
jgi:hypothetical protein